MCTLYFNRIFARICGDFIKEHAASAKDKENLGDVADQIDKVLKAYMRGIKNGGLFDARVFNVPESELLNVILWRIKDATRNSINSLGQVYFTHGDLQNKSTNEVQNMLMEKYGINWNNLSNQEKCGSFFVKTENNFEFKDICIKNYKNLEDFFSENNVFF